MVQVLLIQEVLVCSLSVSYIHTHTHKHTHIHTRTDARISSSCLMCSQEQSGRYIDTHTIAI